MELLDYIKNVEADVASGVEKARHDSDVKVNVFKRKCEASAEVKVSQALRGSEVGLAEVRAEAEREASMILAEAERNILRIKSTSKAKMGEAVGFVIKKIGD
ncbi:MAG: hypothetical protein V1703_03980 [Candidatus Altiarchaeota archaeon]